MVFEIFHMPSFKVKTQITKYSYDGMFNTAAYAMTCIELNNSLIILLIIKNSSSLDLLSPSNDTNLVC